MKQYTTTILAIDPCDGELKEWQGPHIYGISLEDAVAICQNTGFGYCRVNGILVQEIPFDANKIATSIDYHAQQNN